MKYHLSNRQKKLLNEGDAIDLAIPHPCWSIKPHDYFRSSVVLDDCLQIEDVTSTVLTLDPNPKHGHEMLQKIGKLIIRPEQPRPLSLQVLFVVGRISHKNRAFRSGHPYQLPGRIEWST